MEEHRAARIGSVAGLGAMPATLRSWAVVDMTEVTGHAAFHVKLKDAPRGSKTRRDRRALLKESMRHLDPNDVRRHTANNSNIVVADSHLNEAFVNDDAGGFTLASSVKEVLDYGDERLHRVRRKITDAQVTVTTFVVHLPKTMCIEIPDYYPRLNPDGSERLDPATRKPMGRSRWVPRDRSEAMRYFLDALDKLGTDVIPGGVDAIHGWATNFDESTPHIQIMADPFAPDPKAPESQSDALRTEFNQAFGSHREVRDANGRQLGVKPKLSGYQERFRAHMVSRGWPVEEEVGPDHGKETELALYKESQDALAEARAQEEWTSLLARDVEDRQQELNGDWWNLVKVRESLAERESDVEDRERSVQCQEAELPRLRRQAVSDGRAEGRQEVEEAVEHAEAAARELEAERQRLIRLAAQRPPMPTVAEQLAATPMVLTQFLKSRKRNDGSTMLDDFEHHLRTKYEKASDWRNGRSPVTEEFSAWKATVMRETTGDAEVRHAASLARAKAAPSQWDEPRSEREMGD